MENYRLKAILKLAEEVDGLEDLFEGDPEGGLCFRFAIRLAASNKGTVVHGMVNYPKYLIRMVPEDKKYIKYNHAWVEKDGMVYDWQQRKFNLPKQSIEEFYQERQPEQVQKFDWEFATIMSILHTSGPWTQQEVNQEKDRLKKLEEKRNKRRKASSILDFSKLIKLAADQKAIIINKLGLSERWADYLIKKMGKLSVWMGNQLVNLILKTYSNLWLDSYVPPVPETDPKRKAIAFLNDRFQTFVNSYNESMTTISDWAKHPFNTGKIQLGTLSFDAALQKAQEFHKELASKELAGDVNYIETRDIFLSYDTYYWAQIEDDFCKEDSIRMGHCGRSTKSDTLYSLRSNRKYGEFTVNDSHVTVAYNSQNGKIYQSKGKRNQKPAEKYFPYLFDLILHLPNFSGFGTEYQTSQDYSFGDMSNEQVGILYQHKPTSFNTFEAQDVLVRAEIINYPNRLLPSLKLEFDTDDLYKLLDVGRLQQHKLFEKILSYEWVDSDNYYNYYQNNDWKEVLNDISPENKKDILQMAAKINPKWGKMDLKTLLNQRTGGKSDEILDGIIRVINNAVAETYTSEENSYYHGLLMETLQKSYGPTEISDDETVYITVDMDEYARALPRGDFDSILESEEIDPTDLSPDNMKTLLMAIARENRPSKERWFNGEDNRYPRFDKQTFNQLISDNLPWALD